MMITDTERKIRMSERETFSCLIFPRLIFLARVPHFINVTYIFATSAFLSANTLVIIITSAGTVENFLFVNKCFVDSRFVGFELICTMNRARYLDDDGDGRRKFILFHPTQHLSMELIKY